MPLEIDGHSLTGLKYSKLPSEAWMALARFPLSVVELEADDDEGDGDECDWDNWHADHKTPWSKTGKTTVDNGQVCCASCNLSKGAKNPVAAGSSPAVPRESRRTQRRPNG